ncbi:MAG: C40 family peptidase [Lachnospiraceae bacterium]|nr:C40 family peptidase [Lachnospiraceae bacterium]
MFISGLSAMAMVAIINLIPAATAHAQSANEAFGNGGGMSSFLSVLGNSYEVSTIDSDIIECVVEQAAELEIEFDLAQYVDEYENFAIAKVNDYLNVRSIASTEGEIVGHMYNGSVCEILERVEGEDGIWFRVVSGSVEGYVKSDYFIYGDSALEVIGDYVRKVAIVQCNFLNVRADASIDSSIVGSVEAGDKLDLYIEEVEEIVETTVETVTAEDADDDASIDSEIDEIAEDIEEEIQWVKVYYTAEKVGYVSSEYVIIQEDYICAKTIEEERAEALAKEEAEKRRQEQAAAAAAAARVEDVTITAVPKTDYESLSELRQNIVEYAKSFEGTRYIMGGSSLAGGTDCSGFTMYVYAAFGYTIGRTPSSQWSSAGRLISTEELQPGDIVCMGTSSCYHVALYIGDGLIVHEANSRQGCIISGLYNFEPILGFKNVID